MKIIYIHGFNSGGVGNDKALMLAGIFGSHNVQAPNLPHSPDAAIAVLKDLIDGHRDADGAIPTDLILVGTSLGGFYTHYLSKTFGIKCVLINPSLDPVSTMSKHLGHHTNFATGVQYDLTEADIDQLPKYYHDPSNPRVPTIVCLDMADDVIDPSVALRAFSGSAQLLTFEGGTHRFTNMIHVLPHISALEHVIYQ